ncbi:MAG: hypothetical protein H6695_09275 [Deferribacteres bacterium]|nr:hypothetical protein [Deferribacteres bacterium]
MQKSNVRQRLQRDKASCLAAQKANVRIFKEPLKKIIFSDVLLVRIFGGQD